jgi:hypothetical protein
MGNKLCEEFSEIANILQCIIEYNENDPMKRSDYFRLIQQHSKKALLKLEEYHLVEN